MMEKIKHDPENETDCDECGGIEYKHYIRFTDYDDEESELWLCKDCLKKALEMLE